MRRRIRTLIWKEFLELRQTPQLLGLVIVAPIIQLTMLGYAATTDVKHVPIVVVDGDRSPRSRELIERFAASPHFTIVARDSSPRRSTTIWRTAGRGWRSSSRTGFGARSSGHGRPSERDVQVLADGTDANSSGVALAYAQALVGEFNAALAGRAAACGRRRSTGACASGSTRELVSRNFMVPGVLALLLLVITANLSSMAIVRERELGRSSSSTSRRSAAGS